MSGFFRILFFILIGYLIFNVVKLLLFMGRRRHGRRSPGDQSRDAGMSNSGPGNRTRGDDGKVIELDKDQYKVE